MTDADAKRIGEKAHNYLAGCAPHIKERLGHRILIELLRCLESGEKELAEEKEFSAGLDGNRVAAEEEIECLTKELAALREVEKAAQKAADQLKRGEWNSHVSGTWSILTFALRAYRALQSNATNETKKGEPT